MASVVSDILIEKVVVWLRQQSMTDILMEPLLRGCCERLSGAGLPIARVQFSFAVLHPLYRSVGFNWKRGFGLEISGYRHRAESMGESEMFMRSPYYQLFKNNLEYLRRSINKEGPVEFPVFEDLREQGITDYLAYRIAFDASAERGMIGSWATDNPEGFSENDIAALIRIQDRLAITAKMVVESRLTQSMLATYLGNDAGNRVLSGQIKRGDGETVKAAIIMADMRNSTHLADQLGRQGYIDLLNVFFDALASSFHEAGGEILSFIGDGFLAIFPSGTTPRTRKEACDKAHLAAVEAVLRMKKVNEQRGKDKLDEIGFGIGLHVGKVMYGNVGLPERLSFSVFGASVNEVSRLESLSKEKKRHIIASEEFRHRCDDAWEDLGCASLRGVEEPVAIYTPIIDENATTDWQPDSADNNIQLADAEQVVLLRRDNERLQDGA